MPSTTDDYLSRLAALFEGFDASHGTHGEPIWQPAKGKWSIRSDDPKKPCAQTVRRAATLQDWRQHVEGVRPLGIAPIRSDATCSWGTIDVDQYDLNLADLVKKAENVDLPLVPVRSKSGGLHLFVFLTHPVPARDVSDSLREMASRMGLSGCEIFPRQSRVNVEKGESASWVIVPYFGGTFDGRLHMQECLRKTGAAMTLEEFVRHAESKRINPALLTKARPGAKRPGGAAIGPSRDGPFADGPPCLQHIIKGPIDLRDNTLFMMGVYYKKSSPSCWKEQLEHAGRTFFGDRVIDSDVMSQKITMLDKKDYNYTCSTEPMASHCDSRTCRMRRHGVGAAGDYPELTGMVKLDSEPPVYFVEVDGQRVQFTTDELFDYDRFRRRCMEALNVLFQGMSRAEWSLRLAAALENVEVLTAPVETTRKGQLLDQLEEFLTNRRRGRVVRDLHTGRPVEIVDDTQPPCAAGRHYFRLKDWQAFMTSGRGAGADAVPTRGQLVEFIKAQGGHDQLLAASVATGGKAVRAWWVPSVVVQAPPGAVAPEVAGEGVV